MMTNPFSYATAVKRTLFLTVTILVLAGCATTRTAVREQKVGISQLHLLGEYDLPHNMVFRGTTIGGLSGIDYDEKNDMYFLISDDRSAINPARYYTARIFFNPQRIDSVVFASVTTLLQQDGRPYPNSTQDPAHTPDPEAIRYDPVSGMLVWTSEGERIVREKDTVLENPAITLVSAGGKYADTFPLPANLRMHATEKGPRQNGVLEGMTFADGFKTLYVNVEEPLYEDGPRAGLTENNAWIRIYKFDVRTKRNTAQYAYKLDPVAYPANPASSFKINGVPDILSIGDNRLLVMERSFSTGRLPCTIKLYLADLNSASDISATNSLKETPAARPIIKRLLLNMDSLGIYTDNIEGMTLGPLLPNGHRSLLMVADNNFAIFETTQFFLFEIIP